MNNTSKAIYNKLLISAIFLLLILLLQPVAVFVLSQKIPVLFPKGMIALKERNLLFFVQALMLLVIIPVYILTFIFSWWYRADNKKATYDPHLVDHTIAEIVWWGLPFIMVTIISVITWQKTHELDPYKPIPSEKKPITIEVVALNWKWLFIYPEEKIATINYLQIPTDTPIHFLITADAPMNSFWIPALSGQIYAMPGMQTQLHLIANEEGVFRGSSAQISGEGFSHMTFVTKATSDEVYKKWITSVQQSNKSLNSDEYQQLRKPSIGNSIHFFQLTESSLFDKIIMKYMKPLPNT